MRLGCVLITLPVMAILGGCRGAAPPYVYVCSLGGSAALAVRLTWLESTFPSSHLPSLMGQGIG